MTQRSPFRYFKTSPEVIRLAVMLYVQFPLPLRFKGRRKLLSEILSTEVLRLVEPLRHTLAKALDRAADSDSLEGLKVIIYSKKESWGFMDCLPRTGPTVMSVERTRRIDAEEATPS